MDRVDASESFTRRSLPRALSHYVRPNWSLLLFKRRAAEALIQNVYSTCTRTCTRTGKIAMYSIFVRKYFRKYTLRTEYGSIILPEARTEVLSYFKYFTSFVLPEVLSYESTTTVKQLTYLTSKVLSYIQKYLAWEKVFPFESTFEKYFRKYFRT